jgi:hypothetical protein
VYFCVLCLIVVPLPPGKTPFAVQLNNNTSTPPLCIQQCDIPDAVTAEMLCVQRRVLHVVTRRFGRTCCCSLQGMVNLSSKFGNAENNIYNMIGVSVSEIRQPKYCGGKFSHSSRATSPPLGNNYHNSQPPS